MRNTYNFITYFSKKLIIVVLVQFNQFLEIQVFLCYILTFCNTLDTKLLTISGPEQEELLFF